MITIQKMSVLLNNTNEGKKGEVYGTIGSLITNGVQRNAVGSQLWEMWEVICRRKSYPHNFPLPIPTRTARRFARFFLSASTLIMWRRDVRFVAMLYLLLWPYLGLGDQNVLATPVLYHAQTLQSTNNIVWVDTSVLTHSSDRYLVAKRQSWDYSRANISTTTKPEQTCL